MLLLHWKTALAAALCAAAFSQPGLAQVPPASVLRIDTGNAVLYSEDSADVSKFATDPNVTTPGHPNNFFRKAIIDDIQAINGQRVMGTHTGTGPGGGNVRITPLRARQSVTQCGMECIMGNGFTAGA